MAEVGGYSSNGVLQAEWVVTTNAQNSRATITATQTRVSDGGAVSGPGQQFALAVTDDADAVQTFDLWALGVVNTGPRQFTMRSKILTVENGIESLSIATIWRPPSA